MKKRIGWQMQLCILCTHTTLAQLHVVTVRRDLVERRLQSYGGNDTQRESTLKSMFESAGCTGARLHEQPVTGLKEPNVICELPGNSNSVIVVGAHYDHVSAGDGVADNWSGASLLPSLYQALAARPRTVSFIFIGFAGEEQGLIGSKYYVKQLTTDEQSKIQAMICIDTLGLSATEVWVKKSDAEMVRELNGVALSLKLPLTGVNIDGVGISDEESFVKLKIPVLMVHSVTRSTLFVLHSPADNYKAIKLDDYYDSYRLLSGYLEYLASKGV